MEKNNQKPKGKVIRVKCKIHRLPYLVWFGCVACMFVCSQVSIGVVVGRHQDQL